MAPITVATDQQLGLRRQWPGYSKFSGNWRSWRT